MDKQENNMNQSKPEPKDWLWLADALKVKIVVAVGSDVEDPEATAKGLIQIVNSILEDDALNGKGLYANVTEIEELDEDEDEYWGIDAYNLTCYLRPYIEELRQYGIFDLLNSGGSGEGFKKPLLALLKSSVEFVKDNTQKPNKVRNEIAKMVKALDAVPIWGLLLQVLYLQGLCQWLKSIVFEDAQALNEAQLFYDWLFDNTLDKVMDLASKFWGDEDKERLQPLCRYLLTTEAGQAVQECIRGYNNPQPSEASQETAPEPRRQERVIPDWGKSDKAQMALKMAISYKWCDEDYKWQLDNVTASLFGCFVDFVSKHLDGWRDSGGRKRWRVIAPFFGMEGKPLETARQAVNDYTNKELPKPEGFEEVMKICEKLEKMG